MECHAPSVQVPSLLDTLPPRTHFPTRCELPSRHPQSRKPPGQGVDLSLPAFHSCPFVPFVASLCFHIFAATVSPASMASASWSACSLVAFSINPVRMTLP